MTAGQLTQPRIDAATDALSIQAVFGQQCITFAVVDEHIRQPQVEHRHGQPLFRQILVHSGTGAGHALVVLDRDQQGVTGRQCADQVFLLAGVYAGVLLYIALPWLV